MHPQFQALRDIGVEQVCLGIDAARDGFGTVMSDYPDEWRDHYIAEDLMKSDPVVLRGESLPGPTLWDDLTAGLPVGNVIDQARDFGIKRGVAVPVWMHGKLSIFGMTLAPEVIFSQPFSDNLQRVCDSIVFAASREAPRDLSPMQRDVLRLISAGVTVDEVAGIMGKSKYTIRDHIDAAIKRLRARNAANAVSRAIRGGLI